MGKTAPIRPLSVGGGKDNHGYAWKICALVGVIGFVLALPCPALLSALGFDFAKIFSLGRGARSSS